MVFPDVTPFGALHSASKRERKRKREGKRKREREGEREKNPTVYVLCFERGFCGPLSSLVCFSNALSAQMEPCRFDMGCWRPLCPYGHSWRRAARWAALWSFLAMEEDANIHERIVEQTASVSVPQINEEIVESVQTIPRVIPQERIWCIFEAEEYREVVKVTPPELGSEHIVEKIDDLSVPREGKTLV